MVRYALAIFEPDRFESTCVVMYYCCYRVGEGYDVNESTWIVPGTLDLED